jgi:hypothetical protein
MTDEGWRREIIEPINALLAMSNRELVWKEKYGRICCEWITGPAGLEEVGIARLVEEASGVCCAQCGRWNGWLLATDTEVATVTTAPVRGWEVTLCQICRAQMKTDPR